MKLLRAVALTQTSLVACPHLEGQRWFDDVEW